MGGAGVGGGGGGFGELAGERAFAVAIADDAVGDARGEGEEIDAEQVAGLGGVDGNGADDDVRAVVGEVVRRGWNE